MSAASSTIEPLLSAGERDELGHLEYHLRQLKELLDRGLIASDSYATVVAESGHRRESIEQQGRYQAAMTRARTLAKSRPGEALEWADRARQIDPSQLDAVMMTIDLSWEVEEDERAIAVGNEAVERFPHLRQKLDRLLGLKAEREEARRRKAEQLQQDREILERLEQARIAMDDHRDAEAVAVCRQVLVMRPHQVEALTIAAFALHRLGQLDEALAMYEALHRLQPTVPVWSRWVQSIRTRLRVERLTGVSPEPASAGDGTTSEAGVGIDEPPPFSWSAFAGEFLLEHWQKLILCLAVLLIVVSSTVAAHLLLGPLLWSPAGKCALALVGTMMFVALGTGLIRWGAERAGQMMLVATLIIVPIHFMLAGELKLLTEPSAFRLGLLAVDGLVLVGLVRKVSGMLVPTRPGAVLDRRAAAPERRQRGDGPRAPVPWGWQFAAFQAPAVVFLGAVWALGARRWGASTEDHRQFATLMLGLLGFAGLACLIRIGVHVLHLEPACYAGPVMLAAIAVVHGARRLAPVEPDARRLALIELGGYALSALAFALALSAPPIHSAFFSGNTLAVGLLGFGLYAVSLRVKRQPVFLYLAIGALVAARVGAHYFLADRIRMVIDGIRVALGYHEFLPWPFLAMLGLVLNLVLALLSLWFSRVWKDERLARHCHYIGLPLAIAACLSSGFEPLAGAICLSGYTIGFAVAVWLFAAPALTFLTIGALVGAAYFGSTFIPGVTVADQGAAGRCAGLVLLDPLQDSAAPRRGRRIRAPLDHGRAGTFHPGAGRGHAVHRRQGTGLDRRRGRVRAGGEPRAAVEPGTAVDRPGRRDARQLHRVDDLRLVPRDRRRLSPRRGLRTPPRRRRTGFPGRGRGPPPRVACGFDLDRPQTDRHATRSPGGRGLCEHLAAVRHPPDVRCRLAGLPQPRNLLGCGAGLAARSTRPHRDDAVRETDGPGLPGAGSARRGRARPLVLADHLESSRDGGRLAGGGDGTPGHVALAGGRLHASARSDRTSTPSPA